MKETKKQIKAQAINEVRKLYEQKMEQMIRSIDALQKKCSEAEASCRQIRKDCTRLRDENEELKQKVAQYEEWIDRMQEFCNLPEGERKKSFLTYMDSIKKRIERDDEMKAAGSFFNHYISLLF